MRPLPGAAHCNHHHLMHAARAVSGPILWANLHLLFWLSLVPATTAWMGETHFAPVPTAVYGVPLLMAALAWLILQSAILDSCGVCYSWNPSSAASTKSAGVTVNPSFSYDDIADSYAAGVDSAPYNALYGRRRGIEYVDCWNVAPARCTCRRGPHPGPSDGPGLSGQSWRS